MNLKTKTKLVGIITLLFIGISTTISSGYMEIKPNATVWNNVTISDSYQICQDLKRSDSTLGNNNLDPHLTLNKDWGAVVYLGCSVYGGIKSYNGQSITIDGKNYNSTTPNKTGVINLGNMFTQISYYTESSNDSGKTNIKKLVENKDTKYVETIKSIQYTNENTKGQAMTETANWYGSRADYSANDNYPVMIRRDIFSFGYLYNREGISGEASTVVTFRPVIWN